MIIEIKGNYKNCKECKYLEELNSEYYCLATKNPIKRINRCNPELSEKFARRNDNK